jgi:hypothetical protein
MKTKTAIRAINHHGMLLVFPITNKKVPHSLWAELHPRTRMRWEWDGDGDHKVADMWMLMKALSSSREVVYSKWYRGRATFFSRQLFTALLSRQLHKGVFAAPSEWLSREAQSLLSELEGNSPLSTRDLKKLCDLQGRFNEPLYSRAMKELFSHFLIVAFGEVDDGAFPSLAVGATRLLFEDLFVAAQGMGLGKAEKIAASFEGFHLEPKTVSRGKGMAFSKK